MTEHSKREDRRLRDAILEALPQLRRFARSLTGNRHDGDDLMQTTVERVLERGLPDGVEARPWMFKICKNLWIDELRAHAVRKRAAQRPELGEDGTVSGEDVAIGEIALGEVEAALATLPDEQRLVIALVAVEGLAYREAAEILDVPIGTVMSRLARARAALAARFADAAVSAGA